MRAIMELHWTHQGMGHHPPLIYNSQAEVDIHLPPLPTLVLPGDLEAMAALGRH